MLCALDFALSQGIDEAIADLAERQIIGAISCLSVSDLWPREAKRLLASQGTESSRMPVGLTLSLTAGFPPLSTGFFPENKQNAGRLPTLSDLYRAARTFNLRTDVMEAEFRAQIRRFIAHWGRDPDFLHLEPTILLFELASLAVTAALQHFDLAQCPVLVGEAPRSKTLLQRAERQWLWRSSGHARQPWQRRLLIELKDPDRIPQKSSWRIDSRVWTSIRPALDSARDLERLARFDEDPASRISQYQWFRDKS